MDEEQLSELRVRLKELEIKSQQIELRNQLAIFGFLR
jgi:hypothetical protein